MSCESWSSGIIKALIKMWQPDGSLFFGDDYIA